MKSIRIISLGAGVQSSCLYQMAATGELPGEKPVAAIFADTGDEPAAVYRHLAYLEEMHGRDIPIIRVSAGCLSEDVIAAIEGRSPRCSTPPLFVRSDEPYFITAKDEELTGGTIVDEHGQTGFETLVIGEYEVEMPPDSGGMLWRQCTNDYKLVPIRRMVRELMKTYGVKHVHQLIGISFDEMGRMNESGVKFITNEYPLVGMRMTRQDCANWSERYGYRRGPKSACRACPYKSDASWGRMKRNEPEEFELSCVFDDRLRSGRRLPNSTGQAYVHRSFTPLRMVQFDEENEKIYYGESDLIPGECSGLCGV